MVLADRHTERGGGLGVQHLAGLLESREHTVTEVAGSFELLCVVCGDSVLIGPSQGGEVALELRTDLELRDLTLLHGGELVTNSPRRDRAGHDDDDESECGAADDGSELGAKREAHA